MLVFDINVFIVKSVQIVVFGWLATMLLCKQRKKQDGWIGWTPIWVSTSLILNGMSSIARQLSDDPFHFLDGIQQNTFAFAYFLDESTFYLALWLFGAMVLETALDIERMILRDREDNAELAQHRTTEVVKKNFKMANICVSVSIVLVHIPLLLSFMKSGLSEHTEHVLLAIGNVGHGLITITANVFIFMTLHKLRVVAEYTQEKELNPWLAITWFVSSLVLTLCWLGIIVGFFTFHKEEVGYKKILPITILDMISIDAIAVYFSIVALILFRSSQVAQLRDNARSLSRMSFKHMLDSFQTNAMTSENTRSTNTGQE